MNSNFGPTFSRPTGWIATNGAESFNHRFGGRSWKVNAPKPTPGLLIAVLDLTDRRVPLIGAFVGTELPIAWVPNLLSNSQTFEIQVRDKTLRLCHHDSLPQLIDDHWPEIPERPLKLESMPADGYPIDETSYWKACDEFVGGTEFLRVGGPPLWLQNPAIETCSCGRKMMLIAAVGYGRFSHSTNTDFDLFLGEMGLYAFVCGPCALLKVAAQST